MDEIAGANTRLREIAAEAKEIMLAGIKGARGQSPAERERLDALLREKAQIESASN